MDTSIIFCIIGICFGTNYSLTDVDTLDFVKTRWYKKIIRAGLGVAISEGIYHIFYEVVPKEYKIAYLTRFVIEGAIPHLLVPLLIYGPFITFC